MQFATRYNLILINFHRNKNILRSVKINIQLSSPTLLQLNFELYFNLNL